VTFDTLYGICAEATQRRCTREWDVFERAVNILLGATVAALLAGATGAFAQDLFPIVGIYTENRPCVGADASVPRVKINARDIDSSVFGLCTILKSERDANRISVHVECKGPGGTTMLGDVVFTIKADSTLDFSDQDNSYKAVQPGFDARLLPKLAHGRVAGRFVATGFVPSFYDDLQRRGIPVDMSIFRDEG